MLYRAALRKFSRFEYSNENQMKSIIHGIIKGISVSMFILMPLVAFLLWLFMNRKKYFYEHLIFSVHIHGIYFLFYSIIIAVGMCFKNDDIQDNLLFWTSLLCIIYLLFSLKKVYQKTWLSTILRFVLMAIPYFFIFSFVLLGSVLYGLVSF